MALESFPIMKYQLDTNHHVNNAQYIKMALEYLPEGFSIGQVRVEYKKEAFLHDLVIPMVLEDAEGVTVTLADQEGKPYAVVLFMGKSVRKNKGRHNIQNAEEKGVKKDVGNWKETGIVSGKESGFWSVSGRGG